MKSNPTLRDLLTFVFAEYSASTQEIAQRLAIPFKDAQDVVASLSTGPAAVLAPVMKGREQVWRCVSTATAVEFDELLIQIVRRGINPNLLLLSTAPKPVVEAKAELDDESLKQIALAMPPAQRRALRAICLAWKGDKTVCVVHPSKVGAVQGAVNVAAAQALERRSYVSFSDKKPNIWTLGDVSSLAISLAAFFPE